MLLERIGKFKVLLLYILYNIFIKIFYTVISYMLYLEYPNNDNGFIFIVDTGDYFISFIATVQQFTL
jgi:hypothetical protein